MSQTTGTVKTQAVSIRDTIDAPIAALSSRIGGSKSKEVERFIKFAIVGSIGAVIDAGTLFILQATVLPPTLRDPDMNVAVAQTIAFVAAILSNFTWNRLWTYPDSRSRSVRHQMALFVLISVIGWVGRTIWITFAHQPLGEYLMPAVLPLIHLLRPGYVASATAAAKLGTMTAWLVGVAVVMVWNFIANRLWTYNDIE